MDALNELSRTLWQQRQLLEQLLYRVEVQQLLLATGRSRWVEAAADDVEVVLGQMRHKELERALAVASVAQQLGLERIEPPLRELIAVVPSPWDSILSDHQQAFLAMTAEVEQVTRHNRELLAQGFQATRELLASLTGDPSPQGYGADGGRAKLTTSSHLVDQAF